MQKLYYHASICRALYESKFKVLVLQKFSLGELVACHGT